MIAIKLKFGRKKFGKRTVYNLQTTSLDEIDKTIDQIHLSKAILNVSFKFM